MIIKYSNYIKTSLVALFRFAFSSSSVPPEYKYDRDQKVTKISIYRGFPRRVELYPALIIEAEASNASMTFLGEETLEENRDDFGNLVDVRYGGQLTIPIKVTVQARTVTDMERLTDLCAIYLRYLFRNKFATYGFAYTKIHIGADSQSTLDNEPLFSKTLTTDMYTEFSSTLDGSLFTDINKLNLDLVVQAFETP